MCTLTWWQKKQAYGVYFNRDESINRSAAQPPSVHGDGGCRYLCPVDPDGGGTWIWVNQAGLIGCILNNYSSPAAARKPVSRGLLLKSLACSEGVADIESAIDGLDCGRYQGFHLFVFDGYRVVLYSWDGKKLTRKGDDQVALPLTTSGYRPREVFAFREDLWRQSLQWQQPGSQKDETGRGQLERFHGYHNPDFPAYSPLMVRADARTVSQSRVIVEPERIGFAYAEVANRQLRPLIITTLDRED